VKIWKFSRSQDFRKTCLVLIIPLGVCLVVLTVSDVPSLESENSSLTCISMSLLSARNSRLRIPDPSLALNLHSDMFCDIGKRASVAS